VRREDAAERLRSVRKIGHCIEGDLRVPQIGFRLFEIRLHPAKARDAHSPITSGHR
jgi:hypothetical protein